MNFSCEKMLLNITHNRKGIFKFAHMVLESFMITTEVRLSHFEKMLLNNLELTEVQFFYKF